MGARVGTDPGKTDLKGVYGLTTLKGSGGGLASGPAGAACTNAALRKLTLPLAQLFLVLKSLSGRPLPALLAL